LRINFFKIFENFAPQFPEKGVKGYRVDSTLNIVWANPFLPRLLAKTFGAASAKAGGRLPSPKNTQK